MFKSKFCIHDSLISISFDDIITATLSNEKVINEKAVNKVFNEILKAQITDAKHDLKKHMPDILKTLKNNR
jgi:hypothetical protein